MDMEDPEALYPSYYVQSPATTISHANSVDVTRNTAVSSEFPLFSNPNRGNPHGDKASLLASRFATLSRYSSSRGSNHSGSFLHHEKSSAKVVAFDDLQSHDTATENGEKRLIIIDGCINEDDERDNDEDYGRPSSRRGWWRFFSFSYSSSSSWILLQVSWRFVVSFGIAMLVFYLVAKPPTPNISLKVARIPEFGLGEGVDSTGVTTKLLTCNFTVQLMIDNKSKLFGLHIQPPVSQLFFGRLPLATSRGKGELYVPSHGPAVFDLHVGTRNKPMYGAGRLMQDMVESDHGLPLVVRMVLRASYHIAGGLISPKFRHHSECSMLLLGGPYDKTHRTHTFNSSCSVL
ncbi:hypothetical protein CRG98_043943 [Punica granatum]|nr:hypothetical protein CRG98_043943 [Punica granatum]